MEWKTPIEIKITSKVFWMTVNAFNIRSILQQKKLKLDSVIDYDPVFDFTQIKKCIWNTAVTEKSKFTWFQSKPD